MPSKDKATLENLLEMPTPAPVLRRGRGVELSTVPIDVADSRELPAAVTTPIATPALATPAPVAAHDRTVAPSHDRTDAADDEAPAGPKRVNRGYKIREDLVKALKRVALDDDRKLFEVMEEAFERYLSSRSGH